MNEERGKILGAVLAGGRSTRFGSDKSAAVWQGRTLLDHARVALSRECERVVVCAGSNATLAAVSGQVLPDRPEPDFGPLGGLCAALHHALENGFDAVLTAPVDAHPLPDDLVDLLGGQVPAVLSGHWLFGLWPSSFAASLEGHLRSGKRSVLSWVEASGARIVGLRGQAPINLNTPAMLDTLEQGSALGGAVEVHAVRELDFSTSTITDKARIVPVETPIAIEFNGIGYAVMMATPTDLDDFVVGFALAEGLARPEELGEVHLHETGGGWVARVTFPSTACREF